MARANNPRRGESCSWRKLNELQVQEIRARVDAGESYRKIANDYGVTFQMVGLIAKRKCWGHVE